MGLSGQSVNSTSNTFVSTPLPSDLSKPISTSIFNSTSLIQNTAAPSMSTLSLVSLQTVASESTASAPGIGVPSPSASMASPSLPLSSGAPPSSVTTKVDLPSSTHSTPGNTAPGATQASVQPSSGGLGSTVVSVTIVRATAAGSETSTITTHPASTLSTPTVLTTTDSNGSKLTVTPPLVTVWSTSTQSDGSFVTATSVVANAQQDQATSESGILRSPGAVAGIFSVVGVVFASLVVCVVFWIRRHRRNRQRNKWLVGMRPQRSSSFADSDPFHDDNTPPAMRSVDTNTEDAHWDRKGTLAPPRGSGYGYHNFGQANAAIIPDIYPIVHNGTFQPERHQSQPMGIASYTEPNRHSRQSTPSVYPASLSPEEDEHITEKNVPNLSRSATSRLPPRPPRSHLRDRAKSFSEQKLPTPPDSEASNHPSPISESRSYHDDAHVLNKKPILDVRSRLITP